MKTFINLHVPKKYLNRAIILATTASALACLTPEAAEARPRLRFSGTSFNATAIEFEFDILAVDEDDSDDAGRFPGVIRNFSYQLSGSGPQAQFDFGDLTTSLEGPNGTVKYEFTFDSDDVEIIRNDFDVPTFNNFEASDFRFSLFIPSTNPDLVNSLSAQLPTPIRVEYESPEAGTDSFTFVSDSECDVESDTLRPCSIEEVDVPDPTEDVPEPATAAGLLSFGILGAVRSLLKRKTR